MRIFSAYLISILFVSSVLPLAIEIALPPYPLWVFISTFFAVCAFSVISLVPIFQWLLATKRTKVWYFSLAGAFCALFSYVLLSYCFRGSFEQIDSAVFVRDGSLTMDGWFRLLQTLSLVSLTGLFGGGLFWRVSKPTTPPISA